VTRRLLDRLEPAHLRMARVGGINTRVYDAGDGEPILLIHGGQFGSLYSLDAWSLNLPELARRFRVVAFDKVGQGHSDPPVRAADYVVDTVEQHTAALVELLGLERIHVVGHSRGGIPALHLALERPDIVRSLTLVSTASVAPYDPAVPVGAFYAPFELAATDDRPSREHVLREARAQAIEPAWITDDFASRMTAIAALDTQRQVRSTFGAVEDDVWRPSLAASRTSKLAAIDTRGIPVPTLVLWGYQDRSAPRHLGLRLFERIAATTPDARLVILNGAGHYVFRDRPAEFSELLGAFCAPPEG
jgi:pimeloyl-ACP methyl ester carboxylesterase